jgi:alginate O-acetyltransferase complex protein AlgI
VGLFRKVVIADSAGLLVDEYFAEPAAHLTIPLGCGLVLYSIQIYNDFAGYSNMARGAARLLGIRLIRNFHHPYFALNPSCSIVACCLFSSTPGCEAARVSSFWICEAR